MQDTTSTYKMQEVLELSVEGPLIEAPNFDDKHAGECQFDISSESSGDSYNKIPVPDGGYGWVVVFSSFLLNFCTSGASYGYGVFLSYYMDSGKYVTGAR